MKFTSISSSSKGNAYLLESDGIPPLLIEAGIPIRKLREALSFGLSGLAGCLVSHSHGDHVKAVPDLLKAGVDCFMSTGTAEEMNIQDHYRVVKMATTHMLEVAGWNIACFDLKHDTAEPFGFLIGHKGESLLFVPDTAFIKNKFSGVTIAAVECNHVGDILAGRNERAGSCSKRGRRVRRNHMSLETLIKMLKANDLNKCREIHLLHLSDANSDEARMIREVQEATGIPTYAAGE